MVDGAPQGFFSDGRSAARHDVVVRISSSAVVVTPVGGGGPLAAWSLDDLIGVERVGTAELTVSHTTAPDARLTVTDPAAAAALLPHAAKRGRSLGGIVNRKAVGMALAVTAAIVGLVFALPTLASALAPLMPWSWEAAWGEGMMTELDDTLGLCEDDAGQAALDGLTARLTAGRDDAPPITVHVLDGRMVNAFALPGGHVVLLRGLIEKADGPDEIAGVIAHEIGHHIHHHVSRNMISQMGLSALAMLLTGGSDTVGVVSAGQILVSMRYTRDAEREADATGQELLNRAGIGIDGLRSFLAKLENKEQDYPDLLAFLSTHPLSKERVAALEETEKGEGRTALTAPEWRAVQGMCGVKPTKKHGG